MNAKHLLQHFERLSEAPDAIPRLRQFILELAIRGKLVDGDPNDEPVSELLNRIRIEKAKCFKERQIKKQEPLSQVRAEEAWFDIPTSWHWVRLGMITQVLMGQSPPGHTYNKSGEGIPLINGPVEFTEGPFGKTTVNQYTTAPTNLCEKGDLLLCVRGSTTGRTNIAGFRACIGRGVAAIRSFFSDQYVRLFIWRLRPHIIAMGRGIAFPSVSRQQIEELPIPLPSLAEQHRIVAKVNELMSLCDDLEVAKTKREQSRDRLVSASLQRLNQPGDDEEPVREHTRFTFNHLPRITTRPGHIKQLRQTILNLAVRGKLVSQDPNDETATELLKRISAGKEDRKRKTGDARIRFAPDPRPDQLPVVLPTRWSVQSFENLFLFIDYRGNTPPKTADGIPLITAKNIRMGYLNREPREYISEKTFKGWMTRGFPEIGDLFFTTEAPLANICLNDICEPFALAQRAICFQPYAKIDTKYLMFALMSDLMQSIIEANATGMTAKGIKAANLKPLPIPIPPLAEQHRIVAKVDELMALCDQLEAQLAITETDSRRLLETVLHEALTPALEEAA